MEFNVADLFESVADAVPDNVAVVAGDRRLTYRELDRRATRLAHHLARRGIGAGDHLGLYLLNGHEYVEAMIAAFKIRAVPINVNYRYVEEELRYLFDDADLKGVVHQRGFAPRLEAIRARLPKLSVFVAVEDGSGANLEALGAVELEAATASEGDERDFAPRSPDDLFIIYTGGTTGMPKGVMWRQEDIFFAGMGGGNPAGDPIERPEELAANARERYHLTMFPVAPLIHGAAQLASFVALNWGDKVVLLDRFGPEQVWQLVQDEKVTTINIVGDAMARPMAEALAREPERWDVSSLLGLTSAGAVLSEAVKAELQRHLPGTMIMDNFGATEVGFMGLGGERTTTRDAKAGIRFYMNARTSVLDDDLRPVVPGSGTVGRLAQRGWVPLGYYKDEEKSRATFVTIDGQRWVLLGDRGTVDDDGRITVFGRGSVCINTGGEKVYPEEVENALKDHPAVYDAVVVGVPDDRWGQRVAAVVSLRDGSSPSDDELLEHCRTRVAGYKVPREVHRVAEVFRSPSGKPDYRWAAEIATTR